MNIYLIISIAINVISIGIIISNIIPLLIKKIDNKQYIEEINQYQKTVNNLLKEIIELEMQIDIKMQNNQLLYERIKELEEKINLLIKK